MTILVFVAFLGIAPKTPIGIMMAAVVLMVTPWVPVIFGLGDTIAASIVFINVLVGGYGYKMLAAQQD